MAKTHEFDHAVERWVECDVCDLTGQFNDGEFDTTVCYGGALSYVYDNAGAALSELMRVTRPGGYILVEVMSLWGSIHHDLRGALSFPWEVNEPIIRTGNLTKDMAISQHYLHLYRAGEFRKLLEHAGLEIETMSTCHALSSGSGDLRYSVPEDSEMWQQLIAMELEACREQGCLDMGTHLIAVCKNRDKD
jgi:SAM-dependent methyltransferase